MAVRVEDDACMVVRVKHDAANVLQQQVPLGERVSFFVHHLTQPYVASLPRSEVEALLLHELGGAELELRLHAFDQLVRRVRGPREAVPHYAAIYAFLRGAAQERLAQLTLGLAGAPAASARTQLLLALHDLRRPPMPSAVMAAAEGLLAQHQGAGGAHGAPPPLHLPLPPRPIPRLVAPAPTCVAETLLQLRAEGVSMQPVVKQKLTLGHLRAGVDAASPIRVSSFTVEGHPSFSGLLSSTFEFGGYCKVRVLLTHQDQVWAVRQAHTRPQRAVTELRFYADGTSTYNAPLKVLDAQRYLHEREAQRLARSALHPQLTLYDHKQRLWDIVPLFDGDLHGLCGRARAEGLPARLLLQTTRAVLESSARLDDHNWQHNDIKPENILFRCSGEVALADYGLAGPLRHQGIVGTCGYMDPESVLASERLRGDEAARGGADLYALAMTLVHLVRPQRFDGFPLAFHAGAQRIYFAWREHHGGARKVADAGLHDEVMQVEWTWRLFERVAGRPFAELVLGRWAHPLRAERGRPREQLEAFDAAYPEVATELDLPASAKVAQTLDAVVAFRTAWRQQAAGTPPPSPSAVALAP